MTCSEVIKASRRLKASLLFDRLAFYFCAKNFLATLRFSRNLLWKVKQKDAYNFSQMTTLCSRLQA